MGMRFRKSINLGGGFRINFSKSGIGYSWGGKGFRVTKTATGRTRTTVGIPGTGLSWVDESGKSSKSRTTNYPQPIQYQNDSTHLYSIESADASTIHSAQLQDFLDAIKRYKRTANMLNWLYIILFFFWSIALSNSPDGVGTVILFLLFLCAIVVKLAHKIGFKVKAQYEFDEYGEKRVELVEQLINVLIKNRMMWQVNDVFHNNQTRTNAGASTSIARFPLRFKVKSPSFLRTNAKCYFVKLKKEKLYILPDKILVSVGSKLGAIDLSDLNMVVGDTNFIENFAPQDAMVIRHTWQYVNNNGTPDRRFKNNRQLPVCKYGTISFKTNEGFNVLVYCSNRGNAVEFLRVLQTYLEQKN